MKYKISVIIICLIANSITYAQVYNDYPSSYQYSGVAAKKEFLLPADTALTSALNVDRCRQIAKKNGVIYSYSCELNRWVTIAGATPSLKEVTDKGNLAYTDINLKGPGRSLIIESSAGSYTGAQVQLYDASGATVYLQAFKDEISNASYCQLLMFGDSNKITTMQDLCIADDNGRNYLILRKDGRITGKPGTAANDFATVSQLNSSSSSGILNQSISAQTGSYWLNGSGTLSSSNLLATASSSFVPRLTLSSGTTNATASRRFGIGLQSAESGDNFGSAFTISRYTDAGAVLEQNTVTIDRYSGNVGLGKLAEPGSGIKLDVAGSIKGSDLTVNSLINNGLTVLGGGQWIDVKTIPAGGYSISAIADHVLLCNTTTGDLSIALPNPVSYPKGYYIIKKISTDANTITVASPSGLIENNPTYSFSSSGKSIGVASDGKNWYIISSFN